MMHNKLAMTELPSPNLASLLLFNPAYMSIWGGELSVDSVRVFDAQIWPKLCSSLRFGSQLKLQQVCSLPHQSHNSAHGTTSGEGGR